MSEQSQFSYLNNTHEVHKSCLSDNFSFVREDSMVTAPGSRLSGVEADYRTRKRIGRPISQEVK